MDYQFFSKNLQNSQFSQKNFVSGTMLPGTEFSSIFSVFDNESVSICISGVNQEKKPKKPKKNNHQKQKSNKDTISSNPSKKSAQSDNQKSKESILDNIKYFSRFPKLCKQDIPNGRPLAFISIPTMPGSGKKKRYERHYLGEYGTDEAESAYNQLKCEWQETFVRCTRFDNGDITIAGMATAFLESIESEYSATSREPGKFAIALKQLVDIFGDEYASDFTFRRFDEFRRKLMDMDRYCRKEINERIHRCQRAFLWAAQRELIPFSVVSNVKGLTPIRRGKYRDNAPVSPVPITDVIKTIPHLSFIVASMVRLQLLTGCRPEEIRIMRHCDIDRRIKNGCWHYTPSHHKTERFGRSKIIPLNTQAQQIISVLSYKIDPDSADYVFRPADALKERRETESNNAKSIYKSPSRISRDKARKERPKERLNDHYTADAYRNAITRAAKRAGVPHWFPYQLRHTSADNSHLCRKIGNCCGKISQQPIRFIQGIEPIDR